MPLNHGAPKTVIGTIHKKRSDIEHLATKARSPLLAALPFVISDSKNLKWSGERMKFLALVEQQGLGGRRIIQRLAYRPFP